MARQGEHVKLTQTNLAPAYKHGDGRRKPLEKRAAVPASNHTAVETNYDERSTPCLSAGRNMLTSAVR